ncbi:MAG: nitroreductase [Firmicutes bacterium]|nr:nitroreductase [Bacillota bacterium]
MEAQLYQKQVQWEYNMELSKVIYDRRSIRHFNDKKLDNDLIKDILEHAIKSPSAHNRQPWNFVVLTDQSKKEEVANILETNTGDYTKLTCDAIKDSSAFILVFADIEDDVMDIQSVGACIENMILRATDLGIGSLWVGYIVKVEKELQKLFNKDKKLIAGVALGYTDTNPKERPRKTLEEVLEWY